MAAAVLCGVAEAPFHQPRGLSLDDAALFMPCKRRPFEAAADGSSKRRRLVTLWVKTIGSDDESAGFGGGTDSCDVGSTAAPTSDAEEDGVSSSPCFVPSPASDLPSEGAGATSAADAAVMLAAAGDDEPLPGPEEVAARPGVLALRTCWRARQLVRNAARALDLEPARARRATVRAQLRACRRVHMAPELEAGGCPERLAATAAAEAVAEETGESVPADMLLPLDYLEEAAAALVAQLPHHAYFCDQEGGPDSMRPQLAAQALAPRLQASAAAFLADGFMSREVALESEPRTNACAAVALAATVALKRRHPGFPADDVFAMLSADAGGLSQLRRAAQQMTVVFQLWRSCQSDC